MIFAGVGVILLASVMNWTQQNSRLTDRNNQYYTAVDAAEAATEMAVVHISRDYLDSSATGVMNNMGTYPTLCPQATDNPSWGNYAFSNPLNGSPGMYVAQVTNWQFAVMDGVYQGLFGYQSVYRIISNARLTTGLNAGVTGAVQQDIGLEAIPVFQFAIFYNMDLEMNPSPPMVVDGRVHANGNMYTLPSTSLTFANDVTASGFITNTFKPGDPLGNRGITNPDVIFLGQHIPNSSTLNLPIGDSTNTYQILEVPPAGESPSSATGASRLYNQADLLVLVSDSGVKITSGVPEGGTVTVSPSAWTNFLVTNNTIYNKRESMNVRVIQFNIGQFKTWAEAATNPITPLLIAKSAINVVYIADERTPIATAEPGIELLNGSQLPRAGLTVASPDPVYISGNYNITTDGTNYSVSTNSTVYTRPAAVMADAVMVLSTAWLDANSALPLASRIAADTTVNAAILSGIVPTGNGYYSGGVENFPRFLENWSGKTFWYNGSMVVMFPSTIATAPWGGNSDTYDPPTREWAFDTNFNVATKLPPATPQIQYMQRLAWQSIAAGYVPF